MIQYKVYNCNSLTIRASPSLRGEAVGYLHGGDVVSVKRGYAKKQDGITWFKTSKGYVSSRYLKRYDTAGSIVRLLESYHQYIKDNAGYFINKYQPSIISFDSAKKRVKLRKEVGITCTVPLRWALYELDIKNAKDKWLISAPSGSFKNYYTKDVKAQAERITKGQAIGLTVRQAIDKGLLRKGDIVCYEHHTHVSIYSGTGYDFYEGGSSCVQGGHYPNGIKLSYKNYKYEISEILRWRT